ncbi:hypothetical protein KFK09_018342 [Dendrobium nobile]|uniref:Retrotransposon Copia-like N-terminal domain-containing protein n=1 Tax=Dendrobium nobile TaxID=94219 RepID=A0A8T3AUK3_DENNO|nr:hypothetical protein KFK09_018342 [Dendrobium nobile]
MVVEQDSSSPTLPTSTLFASMADFTIPPPLKFLMSNLKLIVYIQLTNDNYAIWRLQIFKLFSANGFEGYHMGQQICPPKPPPNSSNTDYRLWHSIDQNIVSALFSTISPYVLPYILHLKTAHEIWITLEAHLQSTNRSTSYPTKERNLPYPNA